MNKKKKQILEAAKALFIEKGFANTSITDITELAKVSKGTFYNHLPSKNECLIAIIHDIHEQTILERKKIQSHNNPVQLQTLVKELITFYQIVIRSNLFEIMIQNIAFKDDLEIMVEIRSQSTNELIWLARRLTEIFGPRISEMSFDCASFIIGTIQHTSFLSMMHNAPNTIEVIVEETLKKIEPIVNAIDLNRKVLLNPLLFENHETNNDINSNKITELILTLEKFYEFGEENFTDKNKEYTLFLIEFLKESPEKKFVLNTLSNSFIESFDGGEFEIEVEKIIKLMSELLECKYTTRID